MTGIRVTIGADTQGLEAGIRRAKAQISQLGSELRSGITEVAKFGAAATAAGLAVGGALVTSSIKAARELENLRQVSNATSAELQSGAFAAKSVGMEIDKYASIMRDVNDRVGDFLTTGAGPMVDFFEQIAPKVGVTAEQFRKLSGPQALQLYVSSLEKANVSQQEMTFYLEAMASDATDLLPLLRDGGKALQEQAEQAERLGLVLSDIDLAQMREAELAFSKVSAVSKSFVDHLAADLSPVLTAISNKYLQAAADAGGVGTASSKAFEFIVKSAGFVIDVIDGIKRVFEIAGSAIAIGAASIVQRMLEIANGIVMGPINAMNALIELVNKVPGIEFELATPPNFALAMQQEIDLAKGIAEQGRIAIGEIMARPMAGTGLGGFTEFAADAQQAEEIKARRAIELEEMREHEEQKLEIQRQAQQQAQELQSQGLLAMYEQRQSDRQAEEDQADMMSKARQEGEANMWSDLTSVATGGSKKLFNINKTASIAKATVDGIESAITAWKNGMTAGGPFGGPALAAAYAAASIAKTGALITSLKSQQYGGGGGSAGAGGGGSVSTPTQAAAPPPNTFNVSVSGMNPNQLFTGAQFGDIIGIINERIRAGDRLEGITA